MCRNNKLWKKKIEPDRCLRDIEPYCFGRRDDKLVCTVALRVGRPAASVRTRAGYFCRARSDTSSRVDSSLVRYARNEIPKSLKTTFDDRIPRGETASATVFARKGQVGPRKRACETPSTCDT